VVSLCICPVLPKLWWPSNISHCTCILFIVKRDGGADMELEELSTVECDVKYVVVLLTDTHNYIWCYCTDYL